MKSNTNHRVSPVYALVLCPTRELAVQVTAEANVLVKHHHGVGVQSLIGGTRFKLDQRMLESDPCQVCNNYQATKNQGETANCWVDLCVLWGFPFFRFW